jgi:hypothetical protein
MPTQIPSPSDLRKILFYDPDLGHFYWRARTAEIQPDPDQRRAINARLAGKRAFFNARTGRTPQAAMFGGFSHPVKSLAWALHYGCRPKGPVRAKQDRLPLWPIGTLFDPCCSSPRVARPQVDPRDDDRVFPDPGGKGWCCRVPTTRGFGTKRRFESPHGALAFAEYAEMMFEEKHGTRP